MIELAVEVADFGYGPARAAIATLEDARDQVQPTIYTCGNALSLLRRALPWASFRELTTIDATSWRVFLREVPQASAVLTMSGEFAAWAQDQGYWVALIDQLDWMWLERPHFDPPLGLHLVPSYFASSRTPSEFATVVAPLVSHYFSRPKLPPSARRDAVVGLGGMSTAGRTDAGDDYAEWLLRLCLPLLAARPEVETVHVVGGSEALPTLVPSALSGATLLTHVALAPRDYAELIASAAHLLMSPGLGAISELSAMGVEAYFLPGDAMSTLLQLDDMRACGYGHVGLWPWHDEVCGRIRGIQQAAALEIIEPLIHAEVTRDAETTWLTDSLVHYLDRDRSDERACVPFTKGLPSGTQVLLDALSRRS